MSVSRQPHQSRNILNNCVPCYWNKQIVLVRSFFDENIFLIIMNRKITFLILVASLGFSMATSQPSGLMTSSGSPVKVASRTQKNTPLLQKSSHFSDVTKTSMKCKVRVIPSHGVNRVPRDYGQEVTIMLEEFSRMPTGTMENPDWATDITMENPQYDWNNVLPDYTVLPGWGAENVYPAGNIAYMDGGENRFTHINTPQLDVSGYEGIIFVQFRARTMPGTSSDHFIVEAAETFNWSPTWDILGGAICPVINEEWQTFEAMFYGGGKTTLINFVESSPVPVYIDDIRIFQIDQYVSTPVILPHSNYKGDCFDANWKAVEGAESYLLNVYSVDGVSGVVQYICEDQKVESNSYTVTGVESGATYYYSVRSVKGQHVSIETPAMEVFDLEAPVLGTVQWVNDGVYIASWNTVPTADVYNYWAYNDRVAGVDGEFVITDENFDGILTPDGQETGWTIEEPSYETYNETYLNELKQAGWRGLNYAPYTDYICLDGWHYINGNGDAGLLSPELDLSKDNGKINLSVKLYGTIASGYDENDNPVKIQTRAAVVLYNFEEEKGDYTQVELIYPEGVKPEWDTYHVTLTKGSTRSVIGIYAVDGPDNLYIDDLKITQNYKAGDKLTEPFLVKRFHDQTSLNVAIPSRVKNSAILHKVSAVKTIAIDQFTSKRKESQFSDLEQVRDASGISSLPFSGASATVVNGKLNVLNPAGATVNVYNVSGTLIYSNVSGKTNQTFDLPAHGVYVLKIGNETIKVIR